MTKKIMTIALATIGFVAASQLTFAQSKSDKNVTPVETSTSKLKANVVEIGSLRFKLNFENTSDRQAQVFIQSDNGETLFSQYAISDKQYNRSFDLSNLNDGTYTIEVALGKEKFKHEFTITTQTNRLVLAKNRR
jgi:hypothetical protein